MNKNILTETSAETKARQQVICPCCGKEKDLGLIVCWTCFKYETPSGLVVPLKYSGLNFEEWLKLEKAKI